MRDGRQVGETSRGHPPDGHNTKGIQCVGLLSRKNPLVSGKVRIQVKEIQSEKQIYPPNTPSGGVRPPPPITPGRGYLLPQFLKKTLFLSVQFNDFNRLRRKKVSKMGLNWLFLLQKDPLTYFKD